MKIICLLLIILTFSSGFPSQIIHVWQTPVIWAVEGSSITLLCYFNIIGKNATIGSYKWYRHVVGSGPEVSNNNKFFHGRITRVDSNEFIHGRSAFITLHSVEFSDSGMYYCEVIFNFGQEISGEGNGTFLNVTARDSSSMMPPTMDFITQRLFTIINILMVALGVSMFLTVLFVCLYYNHRVFPDQKM
ncbi:natural cytotoxicity triggering receptor 3-like [Aquarana catesbeiana]|uniref:natural cytotoxicity triggering receptor 3-like n=1 Tax=Aquarana catesbeiana TaxID=8400 RepID=UPI003CCA20DB